MHITESCSCMCETFLNLFWPIFNVEHFKNFVSRIYQFWKTFIDASISTTMPTTMFIWKKKDTIRLSTWNIYTHRRTGSMLFLSVSVNSGLHFSFRLIKSDRAIERDRRRQACCNRVLHTWKTFRAISIRLKIATEKGSERSYFGIERSPGERERERESSNGTVAFSRRLEKEARRDNPARDRTTH